VIGVTRTTPAASDFSVRWPFPKVEKNCLNIFSRENGQAGA
jgi:hypothetical protein